MNPSRNKCSNKKSAEVDDHQSALGLVYVCVHLVLRSHFTNPKKADLGMYGICLLIFFLLYKCKCSFKTYKRHFTLTIGAHWGKIDLWTLRGDL